MLKLIKNLFDSNEKQIKSLLPIVEQINAQEKVAEKLSDEQIREKTATLKKEFLALSDKKHSEHLDKTLPEAFSLVREAAKRTLNQRHYDVQLMAGIALHQGKIAEQKTGEGKTLTATLPLYLNALTGKGVHLVTPNDYLSRHGAGWMGQVYDFLGIQVGVIMQERAFVYDASYKSSEFKDEYAVHLKEVSRQEAYKSDIIYGTNHEFGFDYLRDNMARSLEDIVQTSPRGDFGIHNFAVVDEVDFVLIDVARTPLIISTTASQPTERYHSADQIVRQLTKDQDYEVEEKFRNVALTDFGIRRVEKLLGVKNLYEEDFEMVHLIEQSLSANFLHEKNKDYVVKDGAVIIVDQFTGRLLPTNRFSHGLHQAIEAKEGVTIQQESKTLAEISYQNYFRMYDKLAGMTGTAITEAEEFYKIYELDVLVIPTNRPLARRDFNDVVYKSEAAKFKAVADEIEQKHNAGQPVLVGTTSVEKSELLHTFLKRRKIKHEILNAKNHEREALIVAQAGKEGAVTISTNMAGRGVDIILGGDPSTKDEANKVRELGGLHVIGTERHESRRIDNQLRGRSGRQGDNGSSRFYVSLQDDLMRIFGGAKVENLMNKFGVDDNVPLEASIVSRAIENAQKKVEGFNFDSRKRVVEMDDVINVHRGVVYKLRYRILELAAKNNKETTVSEEKKDTLNETVNWIKGKLNLGDNWDKFEEQFGKRQWFEIIAQLGLPVIDMLWMEHLVDMDHLREGIGLRGYAQKDPMVEYKREGHERFEILISQMYNMIADRLSRIELGVNKKGSLTSAISQKQRLAGSLDYKQGEFESGVASEAALISQQAQNVTGNSGASSQNPQDTTIKTPDGRTLKFEAVKSKADKIGRNDPCPCGSGKKYKKCHGKNV